MRVEPSEGGPWTFHKEGLFCSNALSQKNTASFYSGESSIFNTTLKADSKLWIDTNIAIFNFLFYRGVKINFYSL